MTPSRYSKALLLALGMAVLLPLSGHSQELTNVHAKTFSLTIQGGSTLHDWESEATELTVDGSLGVSDGKLVASENFTVEISVEAIKSPHDKMDRLTYEALKSKKHPNIRYALEELTPLEEGKVRAKGALTIAGETRPLEMDVETTATESGELTVTGEAPLKMTDFGMKPPSLMFGTIKVHDDVRVSFNLTLTNANAK